MNYMLNGGGAVRHPHSFITALANRIVSQSSSRLTGRFYDPFNRLDIRYRQGLPKKSLNATIFQSFCYFRTTVCS